MTPERFHTLVETYGADARRWPERERAEAEVWADLHREQADAWLAEAAELDEWLARDRVAAPARALVERIVAGAPRPRVASAVLGGFIGGWWPGAAFAGAGLAGGVAGAFAVSLLLFGSLSGGVSDRVSSGRSDPGYLTTSFGRTGSDWSIDAAGMFRSSGKEADDAGRSVGNGAENDDDMSDTANGSDQ